MAHCGKQQLLLGINFMTWHGINITAQEQCTSRYAVYRLLYLQEEPLTGVDVRSVIYLVRSRIENAQLIAQQVLQTNK